MATGREGPILKFFSKCWFHLLSMPKTLHSLSYVTFTISIRSFAGQAAFPDPCLSNPCAPNVTCTPALENEKGFECGNCPPGFKGDGQHCEDINEV